MKKIFYYFPYKRFPALLYSDRSVLKSPLFHVFYNKLFPDIPLLRVRKNCNKFSKIFEKIFSKQVLVPNKNIQLIYKGYHGNIHFEFKENLDIKQVWRKDSFGKFRSEEFFGYPIFYDYKTSSLKNILSIQKFMIAHWKRVKAGGPLHGDFTHMNILIDSNNGIVAIDAKDNTTNSLIADHFYFYSYLLFMLRRRQPKNKEGYQKIKVQIEDMLGNIFKDEKKSYLTELVDSLNFEEFCTSEVKSYINLFKKNILKL